MNLTLSYELIYLDKRLSLNRFQVFNWIKFKLSVAFCSNHTGNGILLLLSLNIYHFRSIIIHAPFVQINLLIARCFRNKIFKMVNNPCNSIWNRKCMASAIVFVFNSFKCLKFHMCRGLFMIDLSFFKRLNYPFDIIEMWKEKYQVLSLQILNSMFSDPTVERYYKKCKERKVYVKGKYVRIRAEVRQKNTCWSLLIYEKWIAEFK